jgi:hypothetical protein
MKTMNWNRFALTVVVSGLIAYLAKTPGADGLAKSLLVMLGGIVLGGNDSYVSHQRATDPQPPKDPS